MNKLRRVLAAVTVVGAIGAGTAACNVPASPITDIPANHPDRDGGTQCSVEEVPTGWGGVDRRSYNIVTGERFETIFDCLSGFNPLFTGEPGRSPYDVT